MRFALDENTARWFRHALRPASLARKEPEFSEKLLAAWDDETNILDLQPHLDDLKFLAGLTRFLIEAGWEQVYFREFQELAARIAATEKTSIVDRLAAIAEPPKAVEIKEDSATLSSREKAIRRMQERRGQV